MSGTPRDESEELVYAELVTESITQGSNQSIQSNPAHPVSNAALGRGDDGIPIFDSQLRFTPPPPIPEDLDNVSAVGGAVAALVLGAWSIVGSFVTPWSMVNSCLGLLLGLWGMSSRHRRWAIVGMALCLIGLLMAGVQINEWLQHIFRETQGEG